MIVINFYAGPGSGKSTGAASLFARLKNEGYKVELAREVAKDFIFEGRDVQLGRNQLLLTAMQYAKLKDLEASGCEIAISDSPLDLGLVYAAGQTKYYTELRLLIGRLMDEFKNVSVWVNRAKPYSSFGRMQDESGAKELDADIRELVHEYDFECAGDAKGQHKLGEEVVDFLDEITLTHI
jgi:hypothetical protein